MGIHDIELETTTYGVRDGTWEGSPHGMANAKSIVLDVSTFVEANHYPNGYIKDGMAVGKITASGQYGPFNPAATDGTETMAGVIVDNPKPTKSDGTLKTAVMTAMPKHCVVRLDKLPAAGGLVDEVQTLSSTATGGTFTLTFDGQETAAIPYNDSAADIETALEALSNIGVGDVVCTGGDLPTDVVITFAGDLAGTDVATITVDNTSATGGTASIAVTTAGGMTAHTVVEANLPDGYTAY